MMYSEAVRIRSRLNDTKCEKCQGQLFGKRKLCQNRFFFVLRVKTDFRWIQFSHIAPFLMEIGEWEFYIIGALFY